jgi:alanine racemase
MDVHSYNRVTIDPQALQKNYKIIRKRAGNEVKILAMIKADAYGHDMIRTALALTAVGCKTFGVAEIGEALRLREAGIQGEIFIMMGFADEYADLIVSHDLTPVIFAAETLERISQAATEAGKKIGVHLKVDSGMSRLGLLPDKVADFLRRLDALPSVYLAGVVSHFSQSDDPASANTAASYGVFTKICDEIGDRCQGGRHIANSGGIFNFPRTCSDMVRPGISLYGYYPDGEQGRNRARGDRLVPVMSFSSRVIQVKTVPAGSGVSYGHTYITPRKTRLAVIPVGYEDGYMRSLSNRAEVLIQGRRAPIRGRICMNMCMADITEIEGVRAGDEVVLLGAQGGGAISADEIAGWAGTISYEVLCLIGNNNERVYKDEEI